MTDPQHQPQRRFWRFWARNWQLAPIASGIALVLLCIVAVWLFLMLTGCGTRADAAPPPPATPPQVELPAVPPPPPADAPLKDRLAWAENRATVLEGSYRAAKSQAAQLRQEAALAPWRALMVWSTWIGGIVALLGFLAALAVGLLANAYPPLRLLPVGWRSAAIVSCGGLALAAGAQALFAMAPWLPAIGIALLVVGVLALLAWAAWRWRWGGTTLGSELRLYAKHLPAELRAELDRQHPLRQGGARPVIDALLDPA